jgi:hypothetical protein
LSVYKPADFGVKSRRSHLFGRPLVLCLFYKMTMYETTINVALMKPFKYFICIVCGFRNMFKLVALPVRLSFRMIYLKYHLDNLYAASISGHLALRCRGVG